MSVGWDPKPLPQSLETIHLAFSNVHPTDPSASFSEDARLSRFLQDVNLPNLESV